LAVVEDLAALVGLLELRLRLGEFLELFDGL
jgi:hypothetical protein